MNIDWVDGEIKPNQKKHNQNTHNVKPKVPLMKTSMFADKISKIVYFFEAA